MEVVRDRKDNCIIVCSIENLDPMGVHTGDSITVAPAQTLTDKEYQIMRDASIAVLREIGVDTGGSNVQFAINPDDGPHDRDRDEPARVALLGAGVRRRPASRSPRWRPSSRSATRSTRSRTRSPAARRRRRSSRPSTTSCTKVPRFAFEKFPQANDRLTTQMKSVGEVMAIGRTFQESLPVGAARPEVGVDGLNQKTRDRENAGERARRARARAHLVRRRRFRERLHARGGAPPDARSIPGSSTRSSEIVELEMELDDQKLEDIRKETCCLS